MYAVYYIVMTVYLLTFLIGFLASIISGVAGGGAGFITSPLFILMGLPPQVAIATAKFGGLGITLGGFFTFRKTEFIKWRYVLYLSLLSGFAGIIGSFWLLSLDEKLIEKGIGILMLCALPFLLLKKDSGIVHVATSKVSKIIGSILFFIVAILQASFGSGIGTLIPVVMTNLFGFTSLEANATRKIPGIVVALVSLSVFMTYSVVDYKLGACILVGTYLGSTVGTKIAIKKGNLFVKRFLIIVIVLLSVKLLVF